MSELEPTLTDILQAVQTGFEKVEERFSSNDTAHASIFESQRQTLELLNERTTAIDKRLGKVQSRVEDVVDVLEKAAKKMPSFDITQLLYENK